MTRHILVVKYFDFFVRHIKKKWRQCIGFANYLFEIIKGEKDEYSTDYQILFYYTFVKEKKNTRSFE